MANKSYEVVVAVVLGSLARPLFENIKEYTVVVEASSPEEAEMKACKIVADDPEKFDPLQHRIRIAEIKTVDGSSLVYKDDDQIYRKLARALRPYRMWPYLERCKEFAVDYCVYSGLSVDEAAKFIAADPEVASSPAREARGNKLTAAQEILAEVKRQNAIRYERAQQPKEEKTSSDPIINKEPLYPEAGPERYHQMDPEVAAKLAKASKPEMVVKMSDAKVDFYCSEDGIVVNKKEENEMAVNATKDEINLVDGTEEVVEPEYNVDGLLETIEHDVTNTEHVLNSFTIKKHVPKLEPVNAYITNIYDPIEDKDKEVCIRFYDKGNGVFLGIVMFKPEGWKTFSDLRGDFKKSYKTLWEYDSLKKLPKYMIIGGNNNGNVYKLGFDDRIDNTMRELYKCLVKWHKDEIERAKIRKEKEEYKKAKRAMSSHKS